MIDRLNGKMAVVTAFDPGGTTGWCQMKVPAGAMLGKLSGLARYVTFQTGEIDCMTITSPEEADIMMNKHNGICSSAEHRGVDKMIDLSIMQEPYNTVVLEDFILDFQKADMSRDTLSPVRLIAAYMYGMENIGADSDTRWQPPIQIQDRANVKTTATDIRLREWGLHDPYSGRHARDATRHAIYFLRNCIGSNKVAAERRWRAWPALFPDPMRPTVFDDVKTIPKPRKPREPGERIFL